MHHQLDNVFYDGTENGLRTKLRLDLDHLSDAERRSMSIDVASATCSLRAMAECAMAMIGVSLNEEVGPPSEQLVSEVAHWSSECLRMAWLLECVSDDIKRGSQEAKGGEQ